MALQAEQATRGTIHVSARRWFDKVNGNTYHSVAVTLPDGRVLTQGLTYGYGQQYEWTAWSLVLGLDEVATNHKAREEKFSPWRWYEENGYHVVYDVVEVSRKRDLHTS